VRPEDYLNAFTAFVESNRDTLPALTAVLTRPSDLTRQQLRELALALDTAGFTETNLATAWRETTNQAIAAHIVGYIRTVALNDPLLPYDQRVDNALATILAQRAWSLPQRQWLTRIAAQTKANLIVDRAALDAPDQIFKREGGGFERLNGFLRGNCRTCWSSSMRRSGQRRREKKNAECGMRNAESRRMYPIPHSPFVIPHSPIPHSPFVIPHSSFRIPHSPIHHSAFRIEKEGCTCKVTISSGGQRRLPCG
jgi:hypothetical protein